MLGIRDKNIWLVYLTMFLLGTAYGASLSVTPLQLAAAHFSTGQIGTLAVWFAGGIVSMSLPAGVLVRRLSAKATLVTCLAVYALAASLFPLQASYVGAGVVRALDGAASVGVWVACETILLSRSEKSKKGLVMSLNAMAIALGYVAGSGFARLITIVAAYREVFFCASALALVAAAVVMVALGGDALGVKAKAAELATAEPAGLPFSALAWRIKTSCLGTFSYGYFQASVVLFLPLYLVESKGIAKADTMLITAFFAAGMLIFSSVAARAGDRLGHLRVMRLLAAIGLVMTLGFAWLTSWPLMCAAIFVAGATLASISPVSLALQGHLVPPGDYSRANGVYNAWYALGMLVGPPISSTLMTRYGGAVMLVHLAALWGAFVLFTVVFRGDEPSRAQSLVSARSTS